MTQRCVAVSSELNRGHIQQQRLGFFSEKDSNFFCYLFAAETNARLISDLQQPSDQIFTLKLTEVKTSITAVLKKPQNTAVQLNAPHCFRIPTECK